MSIETRAVAKGTLIHIGGIPFYLEEEAKLSTHKNNWDLAFEDFDKPSDNTPGNEAETR